MSKKLLTIFSLLLIFFAMSCNNNSTDSTGPDYTDPIDPPASRPLKDSQYVGKWYEKTHNDSVIEIKQDGSIDLFDKTQVLASVSGTDVIKEGDAVFKATFSKDNQTAEIVLTFTDSKTGSMLLNKENTITIVKK
ncbi:hypothetical protein [Brachyspira pilosicoli]|uniref:hypothetical protein n=1 Tax=Brachyspira pilosicoli TaxID=52584 RepID=UPI000C757A7C|nr:hypothetical protein [Brachyspira pilosicoli]PLV58548.1 hypothetical protein BPSP16_08650 [Brachyspira pilosicoli SP16]